ncbi:MAG: branched-chain amino acid ABC transporter permease [Bdellovibrionales bacterium]|nr:branched-chain amino acid ABC transporter permease [Bdellovibrionales bacterium]
METVFNPYILHVGIIGLYYAILASSWNVVAGMTGFATYSHAAFASLGAYVSALITLYFGLPILISLPLAFFCGALFGGLLGKLSLRLNGTYLALVTLAFSELFRLFLTNEDQWTRGALGLKVPLLWSDSENGVVAQKIAALMIFGVVLVSLMIFIRRVRRSRTGLHLRAILSDELAAASLGVQTEKLRVWVFSASSAVASLAGALYGHYLGLISPEMGSLSQMFLILAMTILGGMGTWLGPVIGALGLEILSEGLRDFGQHHVFLYALVVLLVFRWRPQGLLGGRR